MTADDRTLLVPSEQAAAQPASDHAVAYPCFGDLPFTHYHSLVAALSILINDADGRSIAPTLSAARVDVRPHQVECAVAALQSPLSRGLLLADETGLGKTVESGIVIAQRWAEQRRAILLVVPATLRPQWQCELRDKFGLPAILLDGPTVELIVGRHGTPLGGEPRILIMSYGVASSKAEIMAAVPWDLVIFDEAHRLRNVYKAGPTSQSRRIREAFQGRTKLLLTATPLQNSLMELHGMLSFIDPDLLCEEKDFALLYARAPKPDQLARLTEIVKPVVKRHLRADVQASGHVAFTARIAATYAFDPYPDEIRLYDLVEAYLSRDGTAAFGSPPNALVLSVARKLLASSTAAAVGFLKTVAARLGQAKAMDLDALGDAEDPAALVQAVDGELEDDGLLTASGLADETERPLPPWIQGDELAEVEGYIALGEAIAADAKADHLVAVLPRLLADVCARGGRRKAVIFTESRRTQSFLVSRLHQAEVGVEIIMLNGSNDDPESARLLHEWCTRHAGDSAVSGLRLSDVRAAIIERFITAEAALLVTTESGGEGVNLQDCSVVINYDLPWNPQRLEQRIGRCHRYGQKLDVLVVNLQNKHNFVETRLLDLLTRKFKIFEGVFGASNEVLGAIAADVDFAAEIARISRTCRSHVDVERAFAALERRLDAAIASDLATARHRLFDLVDEGVVGRLLTRDRDIRGLLDDFTRRLAIVMRAEVPTAIFDDDVPLTLSHGGTTWSTQWSHVRDRAAPIEHLKLGEGCWAGEVVARAASRTLPTATVRFNLSALHQAGFPRLSDVERFAGRSGWLSVSKLRFETASEAAPRERLLCAALTDEGDELAGETVLRFFLVPGKVVQGGVLPKPAMRLSDAERAEKARLTKLAKAESATWRTAELEKLQRRMHDELEAAKRRAAELFTQAEWMRVRLRQQSELAPEERLERQRAIFKLEKEAGDIDLGALPRRAELMQEIDRRFDEIEANLRITPRVEALFQLRWDMMG